jgi:hypothetical protein
VPDDNFFFYGKDKVDSSTPDLFAWLISHQPAVLFSQNKSATSNQPTVLFSQNKPATAVSHQPNEQAIQRWRFCFLPPFVWTGLISRHFAFFVQVSKSIYKSLLNFT